MLYKFGSVAVSALVFALSCVVAYAVHACLFGQYVIPRVDFSVFFWTSAGMVLFFLWPMSVRMIDDAWGQREEHEIVARRLEAAVKAFFYAWIVVFAMTTYVGLRSGTVFKGGSPIAVGGVLGLFLLIAANSVRSGWKYTCVARSFARRFLVEVL